MAEDLGKVMVFVRPGMQNDIRRIPGLEGSILIYSLWDGYRTQDRTRRFLEDLQELGVTVETLHTSGHADLDALRNMIAAVKPARIIPVHTFHPERYAGLFDQPVQLVEQGEEIEV